MSRDVTSVEIKKSTWKELNQQKEPGDSFDDVIRRLLARPEPEEPVDVDADRPAHGYPFECPTCGKDHGSFAEMKDHMDETGH